MGLTLTSVGAASSYDYFVEQPVLEKKIGDCASCVLTRGTAVGAGFTGVGMVLTTATIHAYHFQPSLNGTQLIQHSVNTLSKSLYGCLLLFIAGAVGTATAHKLCRENNLINKV